MDRHIIKIRTWSLPDAGGEEASVGDAEEGSIGGLIELVCAVVFAWYGAAEKDLLPRLAGEAPFPV